MIVDPNSYKMNKNGNEICSRSRVVISCDRCDKEWETQYSNYKNKKNIKDYCQSCKNILGICGMKGKKHSTKTIEKFKKCRKGEGNSFYGRNHSSVQIEKWSDIRKNIVWHPPWTKKEKERISIRVKREWDGMQDGDKKHKLRGLLGVLKSLQKNGGRYSGLHSRVKQHMNKIGLINFKSEQYCNGYFIDELSENRRIVIEINGDYWHANPKKYNANDIINYPYGKRKACEIWNKDKRKIKKLQKNGYQVIVLWELDINKNNHLNILEELL